MRLKLYSTKQAQAEMRELWPNIKTALEAGHKLILKIERETRSIEQNALLHKLLSDISKSRKWAGAYQTAETWKRLFTAAWGRAKREQLQFLPALDGNGVDIVFRHTSQLTVDECSELIEFIQAWDAENENSG